MIAFVVVYLIGLGVFCWGMYVNNLTYNDRIGIIRTISAEIRRQIHDDVTKVDWTWHDELGSVTYNAHMWRMFIGKNPVELYSQRVQDLYNKSPLNPRKIL